MDIRWQGRPLPKRCALMTDTLAKAAAERHAAREGATDAFVKALPQEEDWERCFPSPGLHDALTAIAEGSGENAALRKVSRNNPWVKPFLPTATELSKRLRQIPGVSRVVFAGSIAKDTRLLAQICRRTWTSLSSSMTIVPHSTKRCLIPS